MNRTQKEEIEMRFVCAIAEVCGLPNGQTTGSRICFLVSENDLGKIEEYAYIAGNSVFDLGDARFGTSHEKLQEMLKGVSDVNHGKLICYLEITAIKYCVNRKDAMSIFEEIVSLNKSAT